jgi:hemerythrin-like domain-containing protein
VVRGLERRLQRLENLERHVEERVVEKLKAAFDRLERHLPRDELTRVLRILASEEEEPRRGS